MTRKRIPAVVVLLIVALHAEVYAQDADALTLVMLRKPFPAAGGGNAAPEPSATPASAPAPGGAPGAEAEVPETQPANEPLQPLVTPGSSDFGPLGYAPRPFDRNVDRVPTSGFIPLPYDRWRIGIPGDYQQNTRGSLFNPYRQNVLKGDYPIIGQDKFLILTATSDTLIEARRLPQPSGTSTLRPGRFDFFGRGDSQLLIENVILSAELFQGDAGYKPKDFSLKATVITNVNFVHAEELGQTNIDVTRGHDRTDQQVGVQELFAEVKLADLSPNFDFVSVRAGIQEFNNDFRGFLFLDNEPGVRLFGNYDNNRIQFNLAWFSQLEKDSNSGLNTLQFRDQNVFFANVFRQDFIFPGYTAEFSAAANIDRSDTQFDTNGNLVRPSPIGVIGGKKVDAYYLGWGGDGHIGRVNITHQFYQAFGRESFNEIAGKNVNIDAQFYALELSYDRDYVRYRASFAYSTGDRGAEDKRGGGFDSIFDDPNFAGGGFNFFTRQAIPLTGAGVNLVQRNSFIPDLRTSKEQGQANFVNPGLLLFNLGVDFDVTPKTKLITNATYLRFDDTSSLQLLLQDNKIARDIGVDLSVGVEYRPLLNNNIIFTGGAACLIPGAGFSDLYSSQVLYSTFLALTVTY